MSGKTPTKPAPPLNPLGSLQLTDLEFESLAKFIYDLCGITLFRDSKRALVANRLRKRVLMNGHRTYTEYLQYLKTPEGQQKEITHLLDAITTNKTEFFREKRHWDFLANRGWAALRVAKEKARNRTIRIWSAASSSGEEPYSIAISALEQFGGGGWNIRIDATDISEEILGRARAGVYGSQQMERVPPVLQNKYFTPHPQGREVKPEVRKLVEFRKLNLITDTQRITAIYDIIFCCNVIIYFDRETQARLFSQMQNLITAGGFLFLGHAESLSGLQTSFRYLEPSIYER